MNNFKKIQKKMIIKFYLIIIKMRFKFNIIKNKLIIKIILIINRYFNNFKIKILMILMSNNLIYKMIK